MGLYGKFFNHYNTSGGGGLTRTSPLSGVDASAVMDVDATISDSYGGSGQAWSSLITSPADGSSQAANAMQLGATSGSSTDDPTFTGSAGDAAAYMAFDGGDLISIANGNTSFISSLHKTTGGSDFWFWITYRAPGNVLILGDTANDLAGAGILFNNTGADKVRLYQVGSSITSAVTTGATSDNTDTLLMFSHSHANNRTRIWINSDTSEEFSHTFSTSTTDAVGDLTIFANSAGGDKAPNGSRLYGFGFGNNEMDNTRAAAIRDQLELRHNRTY